MPRLTLDSRELGLPVGLTVEREVISVPGMRYQGKELQLHHIALPDGKRMRWESVHLNGKPTVLVAGLTEEGALITVTMFRCPVEDWTVELPGGTMDPTDPNNRDAAIREFEEETGYVPGPEFQFLTRGWIHNGLCNGQIDIYFTIGCKKTGEPKLDDLEQAVGLKVKTVRPEEIVRYISKGEEIDRSVDLSLSVAVLALIGRRLVKI